MKGARGYEVSEDESTLSAEDAKTMALAIESGIVDDYLAMIGKAVYDRHKHLEAVRETAALGRAAKAKRSPPETERAVRKRAQPAFTRRPGSGSPPPREDYTQWPSPLDHSIHAVGPVKLGEVVPSDCFVYLNRLYRKSDVKRTLAQVQFTSGLYWIAITGAGDRSIKFEFVDEVPIEWTSRDKSWREGTGQPHFMRYDKISRLLDGA